MRYPIKLNRIVCLLCNLLKSRSFKTGGGPIKKRMRTGKSTTRSDYKTNLTMYRLLLNHKYRIACSRYEKEGRHTSSKSEIAQWVDPLRYRWSIDTHDSPLRYW